MYNNKLKKCCIDFTSSSPAASNRKKGRQLKEETTNSYSGEEQRRTLITVFLPSLLSLACCSDLHTYLAQTNKRKNIFTLLLSHISLPAILVSLTQIFILS
jgi:hypothetical protein